MSTPVVLKVEELSKQYRLGYVGRGTLYEDLNRWWSIIRGQGDPYLKIGDTNDRSQAGDSAYVWALRDINFEVQQGEVLGIVGRNGAGKSTLLKILSRVTAPTVGSVKLKGRVGSLLEVGTGFHSELTGRENIFLNGTILGMTKKEVARKLDEIVEFAGVARYLDTPVKRYSSGMTVRLGFAIAAHLEPEILIVDEVLAVGDDEFQRRCIGKMNEVSQESGRTILFVSHNMGSVRKLCTRCLMLANGQMALNDTTDKVVAHYLAGGRGAGAGRSKIVFKKKDGPIQLQSARLLSETIRDQKFAYCGDPLSIRLQYHLPFEQVFITMGIQLVKDGEIVLQSWDTDMNSELNRRKPGYYQTEVSLPTLWLKAGHYHIHFIGYIAGKTRVYQESALSFNLEDRDDVTNLSYNPDNKGLLRAPLRWPTEQIEEVLVSK